MDDLLIVGVLVAVDTLASPDHISTVVGVDVVTSVTTEDSVPAVTCVNKVFAFITVDRVFAFLTVDIVVAFATKDEIITSPTLYAVIASVAVKGVVTKLTDTVAIEGVCLFCAMNEIVAPFTVAVDSTFSLSVNLVITFSTNDNVECTCIAIA